MPEPWNAPGCWRSLLASLGRADAAMQLRLRAIPGLGRWGITFFRNSSRARYHRNTLRNLRLALYSLNIMESLRRETGIEYGRAARGTLRVFRDASALDQASAGPVSSEGLTARRLSTKQTVELEPGLAPIAGQLAGAIQHVVDETGDAYRFCVTLADHARREGVKFRFGTEVSSIEVRSRQVVAVVSHQERFVADRYIVPAGSFSTRLLRRVGVRLPVQPVKGYSVTFDCPLGKGPLRIPVVDEDFHAAVVPLGGSIRVAGTAEFAGFDTSSNPDRIRNLLRLLRQILPQMAFDRAAARPWCGLRPTSADGVPIIGPTPIAELWVNTGHGHLGWTMAAGSAQLLADLISGEAPALDPLSYALARFTMAG
jgi:D-amino-acid dehydrogenase